MRDLAGIRVLIVEDEGLVALMLEDMLQQWDCEVVASVSTVGRAREAIGAGAVDLVLLDLNLFGETTFDFARELGGRGIPYVVSTGYGDRGLPPDFSDQIILAKPFRAEDLRDALERKLASAG